MNNQRVVQTGALPQNTVNPLEAGASNVFQSAAMKATNQNYLQNKLVNPSQSGGIKKNKTWVIWKRGTNRCKWT